MNAKKILFPTDLSMAAVAGLAEAESLAKARGATLIVLHVREPVMGYDGPLDHGSLEATSELLKKMRCEATPAEKAISVHLRLAMGDPATEIIRVADKENVDMIVMATHGRTGLSRFFMGSVAEQVIRKATCPVLTYRARKQPASSRTQTDGDLQSAQAMSAAAR
jgi:nucleotide-binding universal stress UspA family protein